MRYKEDYMKQGAFLVWKRADYLIMLGSLMMFSKQVNQIYYKNKNSNNNGSRTKQ